MEKSITKKQFDAHKWGNGDRIKLATGEVLRVAVVNLSEKFIGTLGWKEGKYSYTKIAKIIPTKTKLKLPPPEHCTPAFVKGFNEWSPKKGTVTK